MNTQKEKKRSVIFNNIKLQNAGMKHSYPMNRPVAVEKERIEYPLLYLNIKQAPALSGYEVGDEVTLVAKGKITSHQKNEHRGNDARETFDLELREIGCKKYKDE